MIPLKELDMHNKPSVLSKYMAWNIASSPKSDISAVYAQAAVHLRIYVPSK